MKINYKKHDLGGWLEVREGSNVYHSLSAQKPIFYGMDLAVFSGGPEAAGVIGENTVKRGAHDEDPARGSFPGRDTIFPLSTRDPVVVKIIKAMLAGSLPAGPVSLEDFK